MCLRIVVRISISNHRPSAKRKKPKPRHNEPCLRQPIRYKLYEIRLDTLKKRHYAPAELTMIYRISVCHSQVLLPQFVCKEDTTPPYPHICDNIIADFPKISSSFQNTTLHSNKYDKFPGMILLEICSFLYIFCKKRIPDSGFFIRHIK